MIPIPCAGGDAQTNAAPDGTAVRDHIHVADLADAHILALRRVLAGESSGSFNIGTGRGQSVKLVLAVIARITGVQIPVPSENLIWRDSLGFKPSLGTPRQISSGTPRLRRSTDS